MSNPDLGSILRRLQGLAAATVLPLAAALVASGRRGWALGLLFGASIAALNATMLVRRIDHSAALGGALARRVMHQGMGIRFALVLLASVVTIKLDPASVPGFLLGLVTVMFLAIVVAARALLAVSATPAPFGLVRPAPPEPPSLDTVSALADIARGWRDEGRVVGVSAGSERSRPS